MTDKNSFRTYCLNLLCHKSRRLPVSPLPQISNNFFYHLKIKPRNPHPKHHAGAFEN